MTTHTIHVPGVMRGKQRPRATRRGHVYTPAETVNVEAHMKACAMRDVGQLMLAGPLQVDMTIAVPIPASWSKTKRAQAETHALRPTGKPDLDNCAKMLDAFNQIVWSDDAQIVSLRVAKFYGPLPETVISVRPA